MVLSIVDDPVLLVGDRVHERDPARLIQTGERLRGLARQCEVEVCAAADGGGFFTDDPEIQHDIRALAPEVVDREAVVREVSLLLEGVDGNKRPAGDWRGGRGRARGLRLSGLN